ncbi:MAG: ABC transporter ATP-binding protein [Alphaproteobacteria bacterium]|nr:ABC transporter ATP-binding protein [Alphaproteobacteria bacterium]
MSEIAVQLRGATKRFGEIVAVRDVSLDIHRREFFTLLGPSGSGKTTVLRMIAGLGEPSAGEVLIDGRDMRGLRPYERPIAMVFQSLALFPHMDVFSNIAFPLRMRRVARREIARRVGEMLELMRLPDVAERKITELSGGQRQRVALARALVYEPRLLLLDEPLGALDRRLREEMQIELVRLHREIDVTIVNVTHDQREALMLSDRIAVFNEGRVVQVDRGEALYLQPANRFVASFMGDASLVDGTYRNDGAGELVRGAVTLTVKDARAASGPATLVLRSEVAQIGAEEGSLRHCDNRLPGRVDIAVFEGPADYYEVFVPALEVTVRVSAPAQHGPVRRFAPGEEVWIGWQAEAAPLVAA